jgi:hypothetical protein
MASNNLAITNFENNVESVDELVKLYEVINEQLPLLEDQSKEILRAIIVLSVSALDNFLHDYYRTEIVEAYLGIGSFSVQFEKIKISIKGLGEIDNSSSIPEKRNYLTNELRKIQKTESYQSGKSIENLFVTLNVKNVWSQLERIGLDSMKANDIKNELSNIIDRRNKISHESDWDFINQRKYPISLQDINDVTNFIKNLVKGINQIA